MSMKDIAGILGTTYYSVRNYVRAYQARGIDGLSIRKPPGRTRKLTPEQEQRLYNCIVSQLPRDVGFAPFVNWTAPLACLWVEKTMGVILSERGMRFVFERLGLSYTRPTYVLAKADPEKQAEFLKQFEELKKN
jgi:putative transposase